MRKFYKKKFLLLFSVVFIFSAFAQQKQSSQLIKTGHWLYDDLTLLAIETQNTMYLETQPLSVGEINFFLKQLDYNKLSDSGKKVYNKVKNFLGVEDDFFKAEEFRLYFNLRLNPELYYKSNKNIDWSFLFSYKDNIATFPIILGFSDYITIQSDLYFGKNAYGASLPNNYYNIPLKTNQLNFYFPDFAYGSFTKNFEKWGMSAHMGRKGLKIGNTSLGSILYNDTFETDFYTQLNFYTNYMKYSMDVTQVDNTKYLYLHQLIFRTNFGLNFGVLEGSLLNAPFELRYLNPLMIMHSFGSWRQYDPALRDLYGESNFCAYLGFTFDFVPMKNLRIYGLYAQNEIFDLGSSITPENLSMPNSLGGQLGIEYIFDLPNSAHLKTNLEAVYTSPFLYIKQSPAWSLYRSRNDVHSGTDFKTWIGSPEGPDSFILQANVKYKSNDKLTASFGYKMAIHGENNFENLFDYSNPENYTYRIKKDDKGNDYKEWYWNYYPSVKFRHSNKDQNKQDEAVAIATDMWMRGIPEYKHSFILKGEYNNLFNFLDFSSQLTYTMVFNNKNKLNDFQQGIELAIALTYELF